jgi:hypothetical protein
VSKREQAEQIDRWGAAAIAISIDRGLIDHWPFEITKHGRWVLKRGWAVERHHAETERLLRS